MRNWIFAIGLLTLGAVTSFTLGGFTNKEINSPTYIEAVDGESDRIEVLSKRVNIDAYIDEKYIEDNEFDDDASIIYTDSKGDENFRVEEFVKYDSNPSSETIRKIKDIHIPELIKVRDKLHKPIIIRSASRSKEHEIRRGRSGKSMHVYSNGLGAVDVSLRDYTTKELDILENAIMDTTNYNRITRYDTFIHLDFAKNRFGGRAYYRNTEYGWIYIGKIK
jgi:hypothetical protein